MHGPEKNLATRKSVLLVVKQPLAEQPRRALLVILAAGLAVNNYKYILIDSNTTI